jgi:formylglycine-generating enzyme required for sulfatase activity
MLTDASHKTVLEEYVTKEWLPSLINLKTLKTDIGDRALESCLNSSNSDLREFGARVLADRKARNFNPHKTSNVHVFEKLAGGKLPPGTKAESFQFVPFNFPEGGKHIQLGSEAESNVHKVTLTKPFEMQVTPVTQRQWLLVMGENPSHFKAQGELNLDRPVETVSRDDAQAFIKKMNELDPNYNYRLPTEAEWEYAAGKDPDEFNVYGWHEKNSGDQTHDVASLKPNEHGLHDMHGNVWEWVQDWYGDYSSGSVIDPSGPSSGSFRVLRGGSWGSDARRLRAANRGLDDPSVRSFSVGARLVRTAAEQR